MTEKEFDEAFDRNELDDYYYEYIVDNSHGMDRSDLLSSIEAGHFFQGFKDHLVTE